MSSMLPEAVAVDRPLKLGSAFLGTDINAGYYTLKLDFEPESLQQAQQADLLLLDEGQVRAEQPQPHCTASLGSHLFFDAVVEVDTALA